MRIIWVTMTPNEDNMKSLWPKIREPCSLKVITDLYIWSSDIVPVPTDTSGRHQGGYWRGWQSVWLLTLLYVAVQQSSSLLREVSKGNAELNQIWGAQRHTLIILNLSGSLSISVLLESHPCDLYVINFFPGFSMRFFIFFRILRDFYWTRRPKNSIRHLGGGHLAVVYVDAGQGFRLWGRNGGDPHHHLEKVPCPPSKIFMSPQVQPKNSTPTLFYFFIWGGIPNQTSKN